MDTSKQVLAGMRSRRRWPIEEKRWIAQETFVSGASVSRIAQRYALNANQLFQWRKKDREETSSRRQVRGFGNTSSRFFETNLRGSFQAAY